MVRQICLGDAYPCSHVSDGTSPPLGLGRQTLFVSPGVGLFVGEHRRFDDARVEAAK